MKTKRRKEQGITLIALVVTIIVLLILAGVTIALVLGQDGIFNKAETAAEKTEETQELEQVRLAVLEARTNNLTGGDDLETELDRSIKKIDPEASVSNNGDGSYTITLGNGHQYRVEANGKVSKEGETGGEEPVAGTKLVDMFKAGESCSVANCQDPSHLHVGDYVNYTPNSGKTEVTVGTDKTGYTGKAEIEGGKTDQTYTVDNSTTWRVLGLSEDGKHVLLISGSPLKKDGENPYLILEGAAGYYYCEETLDEICGLYHNPSLADETRSIRVEDINNAVGVVATVDGTTQKVYKEDEPSTNIGQFPPKLSYQYKIGDYAPENYLGIGEKTSQDSVPGANDKLAYGYMLEDLGFDTNSKIYEMLFEGTTEDAGFAKAYWLASPGVTSNSSGIHFGPGAGGSGAGFGPGFVGAGGVLRGGYGLFGSNGDWDAIGLGVRPVVSLKSTVTDSQVSKRSDITEEPMWDFTYSLDQSVNSGKYTGEQGKITK